MKNSNLTKAPVFALTLLMSLGRGTAPREEDIKEAEAQNESHKKAETKGKKKESYIVGEEEADVSFDLFKEMISKGYRGLCITKKDPKEVKNKYSLKNAQVIWLTHEHVEGQVTISPLNLQHLHTTIKEFIERGKNNVVLLDSLEYLIAQNAQHAGQKNAALKSIQVLIKTMGIIDSPLIIPVTPSILEGMDQKKLIKSDRFVQFNVLDVLFTLQKNILNAFIFEIVCNDLINTMPKTVTKEQISEKIQDLAAIDPFFNALTYTHDEISVDAKAKLSRLELIKKIKLLVRAFKEFKEDIETNPPFLHILNEFGLGESEYRLSQGWTYMVTETRPDYSFMMFINLIDHGLPGLCISRIHPNMLREKYKLRDSQVYWLSKSSGQNILNPADVGVIVHTVKKFLDENDEAAVLLHGIGNIITNTSFTVTVKVLDDLFEAVMQKNARLIIPVDDTAFEKKEFALLIRDKEVIDPTKEKTSNLNPNLRLQAII